jgi:hypothetical protein
LGRRQEEGCLQAIDVGDDPLVQFDECSAGAAEAAIVLGQMANVRPFSRWQAAEASFAVLGPREHGGNVERPVVGSAVTGGLAAACAKVIDGTFEEWPQGEQGVQLPLVVVEQ